MYNDKNPAPQAGAMIERGIVRAAADGRYTVESLDRPGVVTPPLGALGTHAAGGRVYFCLFDDGCGLVLAAMTD